MIPHYTTLLVPIRACPRVTNGLITSLEGDYSSNISPTNNSPNCKLRKTPPYFGGGSPYFGGGSPYMGLLKSPPQAIVHLLQRELGVISAHFIHFYGT
jgi:hypothetical protein